MRIETGLQPNHSEYMRLVATFADEKTAKAVHAELVHYLDELFQRADKFSCASFGMCFTTKKEFQAWKKREWDPVADDRCTLTVEKRGRRRIHVSGSYGLVLDDWSREELAIAFDGAIIALRVYTAGYGLDHVEQWLTNAEHRSRFWWRVRSMNTGPLKTLLQKSTLRLGKNGLVAYEPRTATTIRFDRPETEELLRRKIPFEKLDDPCEVVHLEISNRCNLACPYCYVGAKAGRETLH